MNKKLLSLSIASVMSISTAADAVDARFSGFATLGYSEVNASDDQEVSFRGDDTSGGLNNLSLVGGQLDVNLSESVDFTIQGLLSEDRIDKNELDATLEMAFLAYNASDNLRVRGGRLRTPLYMHSDYLKAGYIQTQATRPDAIYAQAPFDYIDGVDVVLTKDIGDYELIVQPYIGKNSLENSQTLPNGATVIGDIKFDWLAGINASIAKDAWKVRLSYSTGKITDESIDAATASLAADQTHLYLMSQGLSTQTPGYESYYEAAYPAVSDGVRQELEKNTFNDDTGAFLTAGFTYDDDFILQTEVGKRTSKDALGFADTLSGYITLGKRFDSISLTPYVTYQFVKTDEKNKDAGANNDFTGIGGGVRYDIDRFALKAEVTQFEFGKHNSSYENYYTSADVEDLTRFTFVIETIF